jgi:hypothetical protein
MQGFQRVQDPNTNRSPCNRSSVTEGPARKEPSITASTKAPRNSTFPESCITPPIADPMLAPILVQEGNVKHKAGALHDGSFAEQSSRSRLILPKHADEENRQEEQQEHRGDQGFPQFL